MRGKGWRKDKGASPRRREGERGKVGAGFPGQTLMYGLALQR